MMKVFYLFAILITGNAFASVSNHGEVHGKVIGLNNERAQVTVLTTSGQKLSVKRSQVIPKGDLRVNQAVTVQYDLGQLKAKN
jgi:hypothetical protein